MGFDGFTVQDGTWLPPELVYLLPHTSGSHLKVIIVILYHNLQLGGGEQLSLTEIENMTGLSHQGAISAVSSLLKQGLIGRQAVGQSYTYFPVVKFLDSRVKKFDSESLRESDRELNISLNNSLSDSLNLTHETSQKIRLLQQLRAAGVYLKTAQGIVEQHDAETIDQHLDYYRHALSKNLAQGPGWLVMSLKEGWPAPLGYEQGEPEIGSKEWMVRQGVCPECAMRPCQCEDE